MNSNNENEQKIDKIFLLEQIYNTYQYETDRKGKLDSKAIGYYTIMGIFFAGFLVVEPILFDKGLLLVVSMKDVLVVINYLAILVFLGLFIWTVVLLHKDYVPKGRDVFAPEDNWEYLLNLSKENAILSMRDNLTAHIKLLAKGNDKNADMLKRINILCIINAIIVVVVFIMLLGSNFI
jgi:hypothetical protein